MSRLCPVEILAREHRLNNFATHAFDDLLIGAGEAGAVGAPPAMINAIVDALYRRVGFRHIAPRHGWLSIALINGSDDHCAPCFRQVRHQYQSPLWSALLAVYP